MSIKRNIRGFVLEHPGVFNLAFCGEEACQKRIDKALEKGDYDKAAFWESKKVQAKINKLRKGKDIEEDSLSKDIIDKVKNIRERIKEQLGDRAELVHRANRIREDKNMTLSEKTAKLARIQEGIALIDAEIADLNDEIRSTLAEGYTNSINYYGLTETAKAPKDKKFSWGDIKNGDSSRSENGATQPGGGSTYTPTQPRGGSTYTPTQTGGGTTGPGGNGDKKDPKKMTPAERKTKLEEIMQETENEEQRQEREKKEAEKSAIDRAKERLEKAKRNVERINGSIESLEKQVEEAEKAYNEAKTNSTATNKLLGELKRKKTNLSKEVNKLKEEIEKEKDEKKKADLEAKLKPKKDELTQVYKKIEEEEKKNPETKKKKLDDLKQKMEEEKNAKQKAEKELDEAQKQLNILLGIELSDKEKLEVLKRELQRLRDEKLDIEQEEYNCGVDIGQKEEAIKAIEEQITAAQDEMDAQKASYEEATREKEELLNGYNETEKNEEIRTISDALNAKRSEMTDIEGKLSDAKEAKNNAKSKDEMDKAERQREEAEKQKEKIEQEIVRFEAMVNFAEKEKSDFETQRDSLVREIEEYETRAPGEQGKLDELKRQRDALISGKEDLEKRKESYRQSKDAKNKEIGDKENEIAEVETSRRESTAQTISQGCGLSLDDANELITKYGIDSEMINTMIRGIAATQTKTKEQTQDQTHDSI